MPQFEQGNTDEKALLFSTENRSSQLIQHPFNQLHHLSWEHIPTLQDFQYPGTASVERSVLVVPYPSQAVEQEHDHDYFEILYVLSGSCAHHVEKNYSFLSEDDLCILPPGLKHYILHADNAKLAILMIKQETLKSLFPLLSSGNDLLNTFLHDVICKETLDYYLLFHTEKNASLQQSFSLLVKEMFSNDQYSDHLSISAFAGFLLNVMRVCSNAEISSGEAVTNQDQQILSMIYEQYATITLAQLAETLHYSVPYCSKYLKKNMGCTFSELIQRIRFQEACNLLLSSSLPVNQIGKNVGYETPENFFRAFKKVYGITPSQYRKNHGQPPQKGSFPEHLL